MPVTKMQTAQRRTATVVVNSTKMTRAVESFSSTTTTTKTFSQKSGQTLEDWSLPSFASPQMWVPGNKALFLTPGSPSPKLRVTRRSSIYVNKKKAGKSQSPGSGKEFKAPLPAKMKAISSPVSTRTRRSSVYKKSTPGSLGITSFHVAQEFKSKSPAGKWSAKSKSPVSTKGGRKRGMVDVEREDSFERPAAKRQRGQPETSSPVLSPQEKKKTTSNQKSKSKTVKSRQTAAASRARKATVRKNAKSPNKKKADTTKAPTPVKSAPASARKRGRSNQNRSFTAEKQTKSKISAPTVDHTPSKDKSHTRKRKLVAEDPQATPTKSASKALTSASRTSKSSSESRTAEKSARKMRKMSAVASSSALLAGDDLVDEAVTPASQSKSAKRKTKGTTPRSSSVSKNRSVSKSSIRKSASNSASKSASARKSGSAKKARQKTRSTRKTARRQIAVDNEASDEQDGSFVQVSVQEVEAALSERSKSPKSPAGSLKKSTKNSPTPKKSASASKSGMRLGKRELRQQSAKSFSEEVTAEENVQAVEKAVKGSKTPSISASSSVSPIKSPVTPSSKRQPASAKKQKTASSVKRSTPSKRQSSAEKQETPILRASPSNRESSSAKKLKSAQQAAVSVKRLNLSPRRTPETVITSTPKSIRKTKGSLRKSLLISLQKSADLSGNIADDNFDSSASALSANRRSVIARRSLGKPAVLPSQALQSSFGSASFTQYVERRSTNTVERYSSTGLAHTEAGQTYHAEGYRVEREMGKLHESREEFGEWAGENTNSSALSTSGSENVSLASPTYSSRCAIL